jgi:hypothetical protein
VVNKTVLFRMTMSFPWFRVGDVFAGVAPIHCQERAARQVPRRRGADRAISPSASVATRISRRAGGTCRKAGDGAPARFRC